VTTGLAIYCPLAFLDAGAWLGCCGASVGFAAMTGVFFTVVAIEIDPFGMVSQGIGGGLWTFSVPFSSPWLLVKSTEEMFGGIR